MLKVLEFFKMTCYDLTITISVFYTLLSGWVTETKIRTSLFLYPYFLKKNNGGVYIRRRFQKTKPKAVTEEEEEREVKHEPEGTENASTNVIGGLTIKIESGDKDKQER